MTRIDHFSPQAAADLDDAIGWLLDRSGGAARAERLLAAVLQAAERLSVYPHLGRRRPDLLPDRFRFWSLPRFALILVYDGSKQPLRIVRLIHTSQDLYPLLADLRAGATGDGDSGA